ncbi:MAG: autotransporter-associated beta strand repeat-containing protein, partial [Verrucomicrobiales bacterium]|nr:autotransporter-associated beta strand repeat-containing protein [Verrucomicrobiales bacterium]
GIGNSGGGGTTGRIEVDANKELTVPGVIADRTMNVDGSSTGLNTGAALSKLGNGALTLSGDNTYTGTTYVSDGILRVASDMALGTTDGGTVVSAGAHLALADGVVITGETLTLNGGGGTTGPGSPISNRGDLQADIGASAEWAGDVIINSNLARIGVQEGGSILVSGDIDDLGAGHTVRLSGELTRTGGVTLSGSNSWGGSTDVVRGTVYLGADNTLPTTSPLNIHYSSSNNSEYALVDLSGFDQTVSALQNTGNSGANAELTNSNCLDTSVFTVNQAVDGAFNGIITGNLTLVKEGAGILTLAGPNTYTGGTVINEGGLRGSGAGAFGENDLAVNGGASSGGYIDLNGSSLVVNALNGVSGLVNGVIANDSTTLAENALIVGVNHGTGTYAASLVDNTGGSAQGILGVTKIGTGTQTLSGANTYTGTTAVAEGTLIFDHSSATPIGTGPIKLEGGELSFKGSGSLSVGEMTLVQTSTAYNTNTVRVQDGGTVTTTNLAGSGFSPLLVDLRGGGTLVATTLNGINATNGILTQGSLNRATLYVQDDSGIGFATQNGSNEIVRYTGGTALTASNSSGTTNFVASSNVTRTAALSYYTLQLDSSSSAVTLDVGANNVNAASSGRGILFTGDNDSTITGTTGKFVGSSIFIANQGLGTATIGISLAGNASIFSGSGLVVYDHADNPADLYVANGVVRLAGGDRTYSGNLTRIYGGGVLELGGDQNGATDGDFTRSVVAASGGVVLLGSGGFSAHGADRVVALGGVGSADALTWGAGNFLAGAEGDGNHAFKLGSASSTHTLEFQNNIDLGSRLRVIDVADGVDSTNIDGRLTGVLSGAGGGLWKRGDGALELTGANTYSGVTDIEAGTVQVSSGATTGTGEVTVRSGATLQGAGTVLGAHVSLESGATLRAGDGAAATDLGTLTFAPEGCAAGIDLQGSVILGIAGATNAGSVDPFFGGNAIGSPGYLTYINDISRSQGAGDHDLLSFAPSASGDLYNVDFLTTSGTLKVEDGGLVPMTGQIFNLLDWSGLSNGTPNFTGFDIGSNLRTGNDLDANEGGLDLPDLSSYGLLWDVSQFTTTGIVVIVPEPGRGLLILVAVLMGCTQRRRRGGR